MRRDKATYGHLSAKDQVTPGKLALGRGGRYSPGRAVACAVAVTIALSGTPWPVPSQPESAPSENASQPFAVQRAWAADKPTFNPSSGSSTSGSESSDGSNGSGDSGSDGTQENVPHKSLDELKEVLGLGGSTTQSAPGYGGAPSTASTTQDADDDIEPATDIEGKFSFDYDEENARLTERLESSATLIGYETDPATLALTVEESAAALEEATARAAELEISVAENSERLAELEKELPERQEACAKAARALYLMDQYSPSLISVVLHSANLNDFIRNYEYMDRARNQIVASVEETKAAKTEVETAQAELLQAQEQALSEKASAEATLRQAQQARADAQTAAQDEVERQAAEVAEVASLVQKELDLKYSQLSIAESKVEAAKAKLEAEKTEEGRKAAQEELDAAEAEVAELKALIKALEGKDPGSVTDSDPMRLPTSALTSLSGDDVNWSVSREAFVAEWTARIDNYLSGTPLAGQGKAFAEAAWRYGVDPRFSPAISNTESTNGLYCFLPYNAWGWGDVSWSSWPEAIDAHVRGLSEGYGYTLTAAGARKYCPPNWEYWYDNTAKNMNLM